MKSNINRKSTNKIKFLSLVVTVVTLAITSLVVQSTSFGASTVEEATGFSAPALSAPLVNENVSETIHVNPSHSNASDSNSGTSDRPVRTLAKGLALATDRNKKNISVKVLVYPGTYREQLNFKSHTSASVVIEAKEQGKAIVSGSDVWTGWSDKGNNTYTHNWPYDWGISPLPSGWENAPPIPTLVRRREMIFVGGKALRPVNNTSELSSDTFHINESSNTVTIKLGSSLGSRQVEVALRAITLNLGNVENVVVRGFVFQHANSHFNDAGSWVGYSKNVVLENNVFQWNSGGGLGIGYMTDMITRGNRYVNNGTTGYGGSKNINLLVENEVANNNLWRGVITNWVDNWSIAGMKHLRNRNVTYRNVETCYNQSHGLWLDFDHRNIVLENVKSCNNAGIGLFIEANWGPITVRNSIMANNKSEGIRGANSENVKVEQNILYGNVGQQILFTGEANGREVGDWQTGQKKKILPAVNWQINNNIMISKDSSQYVYRFSHNDNAFNAFKDSLIADTNTFYNRSSGQPFKLISGSAFDLNNWRSKTNRDKASKWQDVCFRNPDNNDFTITCAGVQPTSTPSTKVPTNTPVKSATPQPGGGPSVSGFMLVNAVNDKNIQPLTDGATISLANMPSTSLTIMANTNPATVGSVKFTMNSWSQIENYAPYVIYGDNNGDFYGNPLKPGSYTLTAIAYSKSGASGTAGQPVTIKFTVVNQASTQPTATPTKTNTPQPGGGPSVSGFMLVNAVNDKNIQPLTDGATISLANMPSTSLTIMANTNPATIGSVKFTMNNWSQIENYAPYVIYGDNNGDFYGNPLKPGSYTLTAIAYSKSGASGTAGQPVTIKFTVVNQASTQPTATPTKTSTPKPQQPTATPQPSGGLSVVSFTLINADTNKDIGVLVNGDTLNLASLPTRRLSIRANTNPPQVGSVHFTLNSYKRLENGAPYALYGNDGNKYTAWTPPTGSYTLTGVAYERLNTQGKASQPLTVRFNVVDNKPTSTPKPQQPTATPQPSTGPTIQNLMLVNAVDDKTIQPLTDGATINLANLPSRSLTIMANTNPALVGSVKFTMNSWSQVENYAPYVIYGDDNGNFYGNPLKPGKYTLNVVAYTKTYAGGTAGKPMTISFNVIDQKAQPTATPIKTSTPKPQPTSTPKPQQPTATPQPSGSLSVVSFTLINADTNQDIRMLVNGDTLNLATLPTRRLSIRANTNPPQVGSVHFTLNSYKRLENGTPYALYGNDGNKYTAWTPPTGSYTLTAIAYDRLNAQGKASQPLTLRFTVVDNKSVQPPTATFVPPTPKPTNTVVIPTKVPPTATYVPPTPRPTNTVVIPTMVPPTATFVPPTMTPLPLIGSGTGLTGQYFNTADLSGAFVTRLDPVINFYWGDQPMPGINTDFFSVRWTGWVEPQYSQTYTFYTFADDGTRLWVNGQMLINDWNKHSAREMSGQINLVAGQRYPIVLEFFDDTGLARVDMMWSSANTAKQLIPFTQLYPAPVTVPTVVPPTPTTVPPTPTTIPPTATLEPTATTVPPTATPQPAVIPIMLNMDANMAVWNVAGGWTVSPDGAYDGMSWRASAQSGFSTLTLNVPVDLRTANLPRLSFQSRLETSAHSASVELSLDAMNWMPLLTVQPSPAFTEASADLAGFRGQVIYLRWNWLPTGANAGQTADNWSVDMLVIGEQQPIVPTSTPETIILPTAEPTLALPTAEPTVFVPTAEPTMMQPTETPLPMPTMEPTQAPRTDEPPTATPIPMALARLVLTPICAGTWAVHNPNPTQVTYTWATVEAGIRSMPMMAMPGDNILTTGAPEGQPETLVIYFDLGDGLGEQTDMQTSAMQPCS